MAITSTHHALFLSSPGMGHIIPSITFAKFLVTHQIIPKITFFYGKIKSNTSSEAETQVLQLAMKENLFDLIQLPSIDFTTLVGPHARIETKVATIMHEIPRLFVSTISTMNLNPTMIIMDFFLSQVIPLAENLNLPMFAFAPTNAWFIALSLYTPTLDISVQGEYRDGNKPISIPGCKSIQSHDLFDMLHDRTHKLYHEFLGACKGATLANGIFVNTFHELEAKTLEALSNGQITKVPVYPVGPIIRETSSNTNDDEGKRREVVDWLDRQEKESVIYVSHGSGYTLSYEQIKEMAVGLELSGKKFVWSVRPPNIKAGHETYLSAGEGNETQTNLGLEPSNSFPEEFYRIQTNGIMITNWAPQLDILKHPSVGGFVSHCGWNSVIESVSCGVPIISWPQFAEQMMNATMLAEEVGIAIKLKVQQSSNIVGREEIAKAIRKIMDKEDKEGCVMRKRAKELKHMAQRAWSHDGSSYLGLSNISYFKEMS